MNKAVLAQNGEAKWHACGQRAGGATRACEVCGMSSTDTDIPQAKITDLNICCAMCPNALEIMTRQSGRSVLWAK
jgi:hypothetical protein